MCIVLFENWNSSQFGGVYLDSLSGFSDITLYRVSQDGDLLEHLRFNAPWDEPFRDYKLENDGSMNVYGVMQGGQPMKVGKDSFFTESVLYPIGGWIPLYLKVRVLGLIIHS